MIGNNIKVKIDKEYQFPSIDNLSTELFIEISKSMKDPETRDNEIIAKLLGCNVHIIEELDFVEFRKLQILAENLFSSPASPLDYNIPFLPLTSYPYGQFADWTQMLKQYEFDERAIPYTIAYLRPNTTFKQRNEVYLPWANNLPACVSIYYHSMMLEELEQLKKNFALNESKPDDLEIKAGIEHLAKYGEYLTIFELTNGDIGKLESVAKLSVAEVLTYLRAGKDVTTYKNEINKLRKNGL